MSDCAAVSGLQAAFEAHRAGRTGEAERGYLDVLRADPLNADALHLLGVLHRARGNAAKAVELITLALRLAPDFADAYENLGNAQLDLECFDAAVASYTKARELNPGRADTARKLIVALQAAANQHVNAGRPAQARALLERLLELAPDRLDVITALLPMTLDRDNLNTLALADRAWRLRPDEVHWQQLWDLHNFAGRDVAAARDFLAASPDSPLRLVALGNALRRSRAGCEAEAVYRRAIAAGPMEPFAPLRLACLLIEQGRLKEADHLLRQCDAMHTGRTQAMHFSEDFFTGLRRRPLPPAPDNLRPHFVDRELVVFAACDGEYFNRFISALLHSTTRSMEPKCSFHIHVINPPADARTRLAAWDDALGNPGIAVSTEQIDTTGMDDEERRTRFACARFRLLPHLMHVYRRPILMLDADLIVLGDLAGLLIAAAEGDFALVAMPLHEQDPWNWLWADVIVAHPTRLGETYFTLVAQYIDAHLEVGLARWFIDQIALAACLLAGFRGEPAPRPVFLPPDIHRLRISYTNGVDDPPAATVLFWSAHASTLDTALTLDTPRYRDFVLP